jgi:zinc protease
MLKIALYTAATLVSTTVAIAQAPTQQAASFSLQDRVPLDPNVKTGVLPNGLRYYIERHPFPEKRAELRLAVNAGGIQEDDDQKGMAHLIEHMGFNGTRNFKKNELIDYLRSVGVRFGADLNAFTSWDETVYMLQIPTDSAHLVDKGVIVLADWAHGSLMDSTEVANERGVVVEEWRGGQGAFGRMRRKIEPIMFKGSKYAVRDVIGTDTSIMSANSALLKRYVNDWYRPDLQAVVVVGDIDVARIETLIKQNFSSLPRRANPRPRTLEPLPDNNAPLVGVATDKEAPSAFVEIYIKQPRMRVNTVADYRERMVGNLFSAMLRSRLNEMSQKPDAPFANASVFRGAFTRSTDAFNLFATPRENASDRALEAMLTEVRRVREFGYLQSELDRAKAATLRSAETAFADREKRPSSNIVMQYVFHYLDDQVVPGPEIAYKLAQQLLPTITLQEVNALARRWITDHNRVIVAYSPEKTGVKAPTEAELLAALDRAEKTPVTAYVENLSTEPLIPRLRPAGRVTGEKTRAEAGITEWTLSNGARVIVKPTDFRADQLLFAAFSPGGRSILADADVLTAQMAAAISNAAGAGNFNRADLTKRLTGKVAMLQPSIAESFELLQGQASPKDMETLFELVYLTFTAPRLDSASFQAWQNQQRAFLANRSASPEMSFFDTVAVTMASHSPRARPMTLERLNEIRPDRAYQLFKERFSNAADFTFILVGNADLPTLKPMVEKYIGSLPATGQREMWRDAGIKPPTGVVEKVVRKGSEPKSMSQVVFTGPFQYNEQNAFALTALIEVMRYKLIETLRESMSGTYSPGISGTSTKIPRQEYRITVSYGSSPENAERLHKATLAIIDSLKTLGPTQADVDKVREQLTRGREVTLKQNPFWMTSILSREQNGDDVAALLAPYDEMIRKLTPAQVQQAARSYFNLNNYTRVVLMPEGTTPVP